LAPDRVLEPVMRILFFSRDYTTHDHRFLKALSDGDRQVYFLRLERRSHQLEDRPLPLGVELISWTGGRTPAKLTDGIRLTIDLKRVIREVQPDLILAGPLQRSAFLVALTGFKPLVSMSWGYDLLIDAERSPWWRRATRFTLKRSAAMVGDSEIVRQKALEYGMASDRIVTFPWGADIRRFSPGDDGGLRERLGWSGETFVLLSTRGWAPIYGIEELAKAFVKAARQRPELRLLMLGNGPQAGSLRRIFMGAGMLDRVHFPGQISQKQLPNYYRVADLYISASHSDGTSISLLEALACGLPVLLSDIPGNKEWVKPGQQGWLFPEGDVEALTQAILHAVNLRQQIPEMGRSARALAEDRGDWDKNFPNLFTAFDIALAR
jgi:glycosyltransferase involved in cell wall biosynthesis